MNIRELTTNDSRTNMVTHSYFLGKKSASSSSSESFEMWLDALYGKQRAQWVEWVEMDIGNQSHHREDQRESWTMHHRNHQDNLLDHLVLWRSFHGIRHRIRQMWKEQLCGASGLKGQQIHSTILYHSHLIDQTSDEHCEINNRHKRCQQT